MPKTLYVFGYSVWSAAAELAVLELGYSESEVTQKTVTLVNGDNFDPSFLKINPLGTIPTLEADGRVFTNTTEVIAYLLQHAPRKVKAGTPAVIEAVHDQKYDPNFSMLVARDEQELAAKGSGLQGMFLANRQAALERYIADPAAAEYKNFYEPRLAANGGLLEIFRRKAPADVQAGYFVQSQTHFDAVRSALFEVYPELLPTSGFIGGEVPGEDDFHMIAWVTRIAFIIGATSSADGLDAFERAYGAPVPVKVAAYWGAWAERESWKKVYAETLH
ncbi:hypothetical protein B0H14DRAFT_2460936 [Mycena olivaceomarginata]|nr:hypothetical protein B0H14DRAFT_2460936 [Mycena olivaceomarginata]